MAGPPPIVPGHRVLGPDVPDLAVAVTASCYKQGRVQQSAAQAQHVLAVGLEGPDRLGPGLDRPEFD